MEREVHTEAFKKVIADAIGALPRACRRSTNLYLDTRAYKEGVLIGPAIQNIRTKRPCFIVLVDMNPLANFGHDCRYRFYDARSQRFLYETPAQFPPYVDWIPKTYVAHSRTHSTSDPGGGPGCPTKTLIRPDRGSGTQSFLPAPVIAGP